MKYLENSLNEFLTAMASRKPIPGGGSAVAFAGSSASALLAMICRITDTERSRALIVEAALFREMVDTKLKGFTKSSVKRCEIINYVNSQL